MLLGTQMTNMCGLDTNLQKPKMLTKISPEETKARSSVPDLTHVIEIPGTGKNTKYFANVKDHLITEKPQNVEMIPKNVTGAISDVAMSRNHQGAVMGTLGWNEVTLAAIEPLKIWSDASKRQKTRLYARKLRKYIKWMGRG